MHKLAPLLLALSCLPTQGIGQTQQPSAAAEPPAWVLPDPHLPQVERVLFSSTAAAAQVSYFVLLPEAYAQQPEQHFPVLYWLHGAGGGSRGLPQLCSWFQQAMDEGKIPPMLVVFPNGLSLSLWVDSADGSLPVETILMQELLPDVDHRFRTIPSREGRILEGFSMGGYGAARLALRYPQSFAAVSILSGGPLQKDFSTGPRSNPKQREIVLNRVFDGDPAKFVAESPWTLVAAMDAPRKLPKLRLVIGAQDEMLQNVLLFHDHMLRHGLEHQFQILPKAHHNAMEVFRGLGFENWDFYRQAVGKKPPQSAGQ